MPACAPRRYTRTMSPVLIVIVLALGLALIKALADQDQERRGRLLRRLTTLVIVAVAILLSLRLRQYWIALLSFVWLALERRVFAGATRRAASARAKDRSSESDGRMSRAEALSVLGLQEGASRDAVLDAYRNLMKRVHPDRGGSDYLAAKLNQAKDVLTS